ncbi:hypothetical protein KEM52_003046 [Ascosphaera acerosa]|nr:hypothetical protein KEM52_003046 [Ascosphaera acerosa]
MKHTARDDAAPSPDATLITPGKAASPLLQRVCNGLFRALSELTLPGENNEIAALTPARMAAYYRMLGEDFDPTFLETSPESLSQVYTVLGCLHTLAPTGTSPADPAWAPALLPSGFVRWQLVQCLLRPDIHAKCLQRAVEQFRPCDPATGARLPGIPDQALPSTPDRETTEWYRDQLKELEKSAVREHASPARDPSDRRRGRSPSPRQTTHRTRQSSPSSFSARPQPCYSNPRRFQQRQFSSTTAYARHAACDTDDSDVDSATDDDSDVDVPCSRRSRHPAYFPSMAQSDKLLPRLGLQHGSTKVCYEEEHARRHTVPLAAYSKKPAYGYEPKNAQYIYVMPKSTSPLRMYDDVPISKTRGSSGSSARSTASSSSSRSRRASSAYVSEDDSDSDYFRAPVRVSADVDVGVDVRAGDSRRPARSRAVSSQLPPRVAPPHGRSTSRDSQKRQSCQAKAPRSNMLRPEVYPSPSFSSASISSSSSSSTSSSSRFPAKSRRDGHEQISSRGRRLSRASPEEDDDDDDDDNDDGHGPVRTRNGSPHPIIVAKAYSDEYAIQAIARKPLVGTSHQDRRASCSSASSKSCSSTSSRRDGRSVQDWERQRGRPRSDWSSKLKDSIMARVL